ncbi:hypothetical protein D7S86_08160 [Pararobbsia silviterrae]|uniref:Uncharacterized protein n=1 Tax=Pararobbsia silviterrae TaxID=1792498 RepID=A0A494Y4F2_9BURK|nr:hypothetical protein D7S86_08160 [Pararobbsia silviterrae]
MTTNTPLNCQSVSLSPGIWLVWGNVVFSPASTTTTTSFYAGISTTSATFNTNAGQRIYGTTAAPTANILAAPPLVVPISTTTTVYLVGGSIFATSTQTCGGIINYLRVR